MFKGKSSRKINCQKDSLGAFVKKTYLEILSKRLTWKLSKKTHLEIKSRRNFPGSIKEEKKSLSQSRQNRYLVQKFG